MSLLELKAGIANIAGFGVLLYKTSRNFGGFPNPFSKLINS